MPANLPPQYVEAERRYREAVTAPEKIAALEEMLAVMPKHKGTDHLKAELRRRIAKLSQSMDKKLATQRAKAFIDKEGAAQVIIIGPPNTGKSQLVCALTNARPLVADYPFTTQEATAGMMEFENIQLQLIDTPPLVADSAFWWLPHMVRRADAMLLMVDLSHDPVSQVEATLAELAKSKLEAGGDQIKTLIVGNKIDLEGSAANYAVLKERYAGKLPTIAISAAAGIGLEDLKRRIFELLNVIRVYTKTPGGKPALSDPVVLKKGSTLSQAAAEVHKDFAAKLRYARVWGSGKHEGIMVSREHVLEDGDIIELHI